MSSLFIQCDDNSWVNLTVLLSVALYCSTAGWVLPPCLHSASVRSVEVGVAPLSLLQKKNMADPHSGTITL